VNGIIDGNSQGDSRDQDGRNIHWHPQPAHDADCGQHGQKVRDHTNQRKSQTPKQEEQQEEYDEKADSKTTDLASGEQAVHPDIHRN